MAEKKGTRKRKESALKRFILNRTGASRITAGLKKPVKTPPSPRLKPAKGKPAASSRPASEIGFNPPGFVRNKRKDPNKKKN